MKNQSFFQLPIPFGETASDREKIFHSCVFFQGHHLHNFKYMNSKEKITCADEVDLPTKIAIIQN